MDWFTSDTHFNHAKIIKHCNRPFMDAETMNLALIAYWAESVKAGDSVYFLGDFCLGREPSALEILAKLPGRKILVTGNHDGARIKASHHWSHVYDYFELSERNTKLVLCHYPFAVWNGSHHGSINLHGHSHGTFKNKNARQIDVGVDCHDFRPLSLDDIFDIVTSREAAGDKPVIPLDHHGQNAGV